MAPPVVRELWEIEELVEEILIRTPPEEPAVLIRASLACKAWCSLLSGHAFRSRYRTLHKTPPILGFLQSWRKDVERFVPVKNFRPRNPNRRDTFVLDCHHGRVLVACELDEVDKEEEDEKKEEEEGEEKEEEEWEGEEEEGEEWEEEEEEEEEKEHELKMVVWDPVSGSRTELPDPDILVITDLGLFAIDLKSQRLRKLSINLPGLIENRCGLDQRLFEKLFLYKSFNNPPAVAGVVGEARAIEAGGVEVQI